MEKILDIVVFLKLENMSFQAIPITDPSTFAGYKTFMITGLPRRLVVFYLVSSVFFKLVNLLIYQMAPRLN